MDLACAIAIVLCLLAAFVRVGGSGPRALHARVAAEGGSVWLHEGTLNALYGVVALVGSACARAGVTANAITAFSLVLALAASVALALGHLGVGALLGSLAAVSDALDGFVARATNTADAAGEVLDAAVDRYVEFALFVGLAGHFHADLAAMTVVFAACCGSFMVSYSTAKAEALSVVPPRGSMRRTERTALILFAALLAPIAAWLGFSARWAEAPLLIALAVVALFGNLSAITRFAWVMRVLRERAQQRVPTIEASAQIADRST